VKRIIAAAAMILATTSTARAGDIGHFVGGLMNIRDYLVPEPGFYFALYNYYYETERLNDSHGDRSSTVTVDPPLPGPGVTLDVDLDLQMYVLAPALMWVTDIEPLGIKYGALVTPTFANASVHAAVSTLRGRGGTFDMGTFGMGDLFVQPLWLGLTLEHFDFALAYAFYAPVGRYDTEVRTLSVVGPVKVEESDNLGYGFWTHQFQGAAAWYPMDNKGTAIVNALTFETNSKKEGFDLTPGDALTYSWGISQYLPLTRDQSLLLEIGPAGYDTWQITKDTGSAGRGERDQTHAVGGQLGLTYVPWATLVNFHGFAEFHSETRSQGFSLGLNVAKKFF
jgi:hypothetical protein